MSFNIFDNIEDNTDDALNKLLKSVGKTNDQFFAEFTDMVSSLDKTPDGYIKSTISNLNKLAKFDRIYASTLTKSAYWGATKSYLNAFSGNSKLLNTYFQSLELGFDSTKSIYLTIRQSAVETTIEKLLQSGLDANFKAPIRSILQNSVVNGANKSEAIASLKNYLYGQGERVAALQRYATTVATDAINQYTGQYIATVSDDLKLEHYNYNGTKITESRELCIHLAGKYASYDNLESYLNSKSPWSGMIPGTNMGNFITNRGGYNCRHFAIPVSKTVYDANESKQL
jgi:hypothetical protein